MVRIDRAVLFDHEIRGVVEVTCEWMLIVRAAAGSKQEIGNAVARRKRAERVVVARDHVVDAVFDQERLDALIPTRGLVIP